MSKTLVLANYCGPSGIQIHQSDVEKLINPKEFANDSIVDVGAHYICSDYPEVMRDVLVIGALSKANGAYENYDKFKQAVTKAHELTPEDVLSKRALLFIYGDSATLHWSLFVALDPGSKDRKILHYDSAAGHDSNQVFTALEDYMNKLRAEAGMNEVKYPSAKAAVPVQPDGTSCGFFTVAFLGCVLHELQGCTAAKSAFNSDRANWFHPLNGVLVRDYIAKKLADDLGPIDPEAAQKAAGFQSVDSCGGACVYVKPSAYTPEIFRKQQDASSQNSRFNKRTTRATFGTPRPVKTLPKPALPAALLGGKGTSCIMSVQPQKEAASHGLAPIDEDDESEMYGISMGAKRRHGPFDDAFARALDVLGDAPDAGADAGGAGGLEALRGVLGDIKDMMAELVAEVQSSKHVQSTTTKVLETGLEKLVAVVEKTKELGYADKARVRAELYPICTQVFREAPYMLGQDVVGTILEYTKCENLHSFLQQQDRQLLQTLRRMARTQIRTNIRGRAQTEIIKACKSAWPDTCKHNIRDMEKCKELLAGNAYLGEYDTEGFKYVLFKYYKYITKDNLATDLSSVSMYQSEIAFVDCTVRGYLKGQRQTQEEQSANSTSSPDGRGVKRSRGGNEVVLRHINLMADFTEAEERAVAFFRRNKDYIPCGELLVRSALLRQVRNKVIGSAKQDCVGLQMEDPV